MNISIAMTTYNGEKYIREQLDSIVNQLEETDEIIISDDGSVDSTLEIINKFLVKDNRVKLYKNNGLGVVKNFEFAISKCNKEIIFLCDQDDLWMKDKVKKVKEYFKLNKQKLLLLHNGIDFSDDDLSNNKELITQKKQGVMSNIIRSSYWGCCMAFRIDFVEYILPFPKGLVAHDQWIGLIGEYKGTSGYIDEPLIMHRKHQQNVSRKLSAIGRIRFRWNLFIRLLLYPYKRSKNL